MDIYIVDMITDLDEQVSVTVQAYDYAEAEAIGVTMLENGELNCAGQICVSCVAYQA